MDIEWKRISKYSMKGRPVKIYLRMEYNNQTALGPANKVASKEKKKYSEKHINKKTGYGEG